MFIDVLKKSGITLIEVMISIVVFGTGVLVVMSMITSNISWLYAIKDKDTAIIIAKEGIDMMYHVRDSNIERNLFWNCAVIDINEPSTCGEYFYDDSEKFFTIGMDVDGTYEVEEMATTGDAKIWYHTGVLYDTTGGGSGSIAEGFWYDHTSLSGSETIYSRWVSFAPAAGYETNTGSILEITSEVQYHRGGTVKSVILQSFIGDIR